MRNYFQDCSYSQCSEAYEVVQNLSSPALIEPVLCKTLQNISQDCLDILDTCFSEVDKKDMVENFINNLRGFLERIGGESIKNGTLYDCDCEFEKDTIAKLVIASLEVNTVDIEEYHLLEVNTNDTDDSKPKLDANETNNYIELRYFATDEQMLPTIQYQNMKIHKKNDDMETNETEHKENAIYLVYLNDGKSKVIRATPNYFKVASFVLLSMLTI